MLDWKLKIKNKKSIEKDGISDLAMFLCWPDLRPWEKEALRLKTLLYLIARFPEGGDDWKEVVDLIAKAEGGKERD